MSKEFNECQFLESLGRLRQVDLIDAQFRYKNWDTVVDFACKNEQEQEEAEEEDNNDTEE